MPKESTRQSVRFRIIDRGLDFEIRQQGATVWVALFGILDRPRLAQLMRGLAPVLHRRGLRIVLDGRRLYHIDYRAVKPLIQWSKSLREFDHRLLLTRWSDYLKAILSMEDWDRELSPGYARLAAWPVPAPSKVIVEQLP